MQRSVKREKSSSIDSPMKEPFEAYALYLDELNGKRERIVKASRDITMNSKKVIFQVQRIRKSGKEAVLNQAENDLVAVRDQNMSRLIKELKGTDFWKLRRAYSWGVQEYIEAVTFFKFCQTGTLMNLDEINATLLPLSDDPTLEPLQINVLDYLLGVADLTGELMRLAMGRISEGELQFAENICNFVRDIYRQFTILGPNMYECTDMKAKMDTMRQSVMKIENACYSIHVRRSEYIPSSEPSDTSNYAAVLGAPALYL